MSHFKLIAFAEDEWNTKKETETFGLLTDNAVNHLLCACTSNLLAGYFKNRISNKCWERRAQRHENEEQTKKYWHDKEIVLSYIK